MEKRTVFKCFISSPSDCSSERNACEDVVDDLNQTLAKHLGVILETVRWERDVLPDMGSNAQEIIDETIETIKYDVFIGIMKNRFGTPTLKAGSGTEHEYRHALTKKSIDPSSLPRILFFFGNEPVDPNSFDFKQFEKVKEFKSSISPNGLYVEFNNQENFVTLLKEKLQLFIKAFSPLEQPNKKIQEIDIILRKLENDLSNSLKTYNEKSPVWIEPIVSTKREIPNNPTKNEENKTDIHFFINTPSNCIIKAPSEFGLTTLAHHIKLEAWKAGKTFLYIDAKGTKKHKVIRDIASETENYYFKKTSDLDCILLDSVSFEEHGIMQIVKNICDEYPSVPLIIFNTIDNNYFLKSEDDEKVEIKREFDSFYLLPLQQSAVRKIVCSYSRVKTLEEDNDTLLAKITKDLETLNIHRTVKNCISILRACSRIGKEYSPINRTKLLETILSTIFDEYEIPTYRDKKPDIKDCSFVLGYFCELLLLRNDFDFNEEYFRATLREFCLKNYIELDLNYLLHALLDNSILGTRTKDIYYFKNAYWVFYFLAQRMSMNKEFLEKIYSNGWYIDFPEIIEFYTGIDRNKEDALIRLKNDMDAILLKVKTKMNIPDLNPYKSISWNPDVSVLEKEQQKISENVISSGLPDEVKDKYDDRNYNQKRPYNQVINSIIREYSFLVLMRQISACSRALRNSDFVDASIKKELLGKITEAWNEMNKLLIVLSPLLADKGKISFEGAAFYLNEDDFNIEDPEEKRLQVLLALPTNIVRFFKDDLFSSKMAPLLIDKARNEPNSLLKHELMLLLIAERPKDWHKTIDSYIVGLDKNSFYLSDAIQALKFVKEFKAVEIEEKRTIDMLIQKCRAKHIFNKNNPDIGLIKKIKKLR